MTIQEAIDELVSDTKPYALVRMDKRRYWETVRRIQLGKAKLSTIESFLRKFGYEGSFNEWIKKEINQ